MPKRNSRKRLPWSQFGNPIEKYPLDGEEARYEQYQRMLKLKKHYGIDREQGWRPWYELALAIASDFDDGLKIVDYVEPKGKTARRWRGVEGRVLITEVEAVQARHPERSVAWCLKQIKEYKPRLYANMPLRQLEVGYQEAKRCHLPAKKLRRWDGRTVTKR